MRHGTISLIFVALPLVVFVANTLISLKLLALKGRQLALCWLWLALLVGLVVAALGLSHDHACGVGVDWDDGY